MAIFIQKYAVDKHNICINTLKRLSVYPKGRVLLFLVSLWICVDDGVCRQVDLACMTRECVLFRFEVPVDNPQTVQMVQGQSQLCQVELDILFGKHNLEYIRRRKCTHGQQCISRL